MKSKIIVLVVVVVTLFVLGPTGAWWLLSASRDVARGAIQDATPDAVLAAKIRIGLRDFDEEILKYEDSLAGLLEQSRACEARSADLAGALAKEKATLRQAKELLDQKKSEYVIGGKTYSMEQVSADAQARLQRCQELQRRVDAEGQFSERLSQSIAMGRSNLQKAQALRREKAEQLQDIEPRLASAKLAIQVNNLVEGLRVAPLAEGTELGKDFEEYERRVRLLERRGQLLADPAGAAAIVDYEGGRPFHSEVGDAIARFLEANASPGGIER